jgi:3-hydroxyisobutyrate dehydrogenase
MCDTRRYGSLDGNALVGRSRYEQSSISRSRSYGLAYGCQPFEGRTHGHRVEQESGGSGGARRLGARKASSPKEAAEGADFAFAIVRDDDASQNVWLDSTNGALAGMHPGAVAIESSTLTPEWIRELSEHFREKGISLLDAPVSGSRPQAEAAQLVYLIGGDAKALSAAEPLLKVLGSSIRHVGPIGTGSLAKLTTNTLLGVQVDTIAELIAMLRRQGVDPNQILDAVASTPVWSTVAGRIAASMLSGTFAPQFPIELIEKDFSNTVHTAGGEENAPVITAIRNIFRKAISEGLGELNMTAVVKLFEGHKD